MNRLICMALLAFCGLFFSGSCNTEPQEPIAPKEIRLICGGWGVSLGKAPVVAGDTFTAQVCGWERKAGLEGWVEAPTWENSASITASATGSPIVLDPIRMYDGSGLLTEVRAWTPEGSISGGLVRFAAPTVEADVMLTREVSGTAEAPIASPLLFEHLTTRLRFVAVDKGWPASEKILSVVIKGVRLPEGIDLVTGQLISDRDVDLDVPGLGDGVSPTDQGGAALGRGVMVVPIRSNKLYLEVKTTLKTYPSVEVTTQDVGFVVGRSYLVTLTFERGRFVEVGSELEDWTPAPPGQGDVH